MIQRIQSVFLLITVMALAVFLGTNTYTKVISSSEMVALNPYRVFHQVGTIATGKPLFYIAVLAGLAILLGVFAIFQYKNRVRQSMFVSVNALLMVITLATSVYHIIKDARPLSPGTEETFDVGFFALIIAMISNVAANWFIRRDEKLVRSADRMR